jgi:deoxyribodipyrimidine photolyase-related protein
MNNNLLIIFPSQLFEKKYIDKIFNYDNNNNFIIVIWEHEYFFTRYPYHKMKLVLHRSTMQKYYDDLSSKYKKYYIENISKNHNNQIIEIIKKHKINKISLFNPIEKDLINLINSKKLIKYENDIEYLLFPTPYFLITSNINTINDIDTKLTTTRHDLFYKIQRINYNIMIKKNNSKYIPVGNKWSFDTENREPFIKNQKEPSLLIFKTNKKYIKNAINYVNKNFKDHYGLCNEEDFIYPIDHDSSKKWLKYFIKTKLDNFGKYEDAISMNINFGYHSLLSPLNNIGLITSNDIINEVEKYDKNLASKEGFIRQVIGWREYCYYIYDKYDENLIKNKFYDKNNGKIPLKFWEGKTGIPIIDNIINKVNKYAYSHHIERLMCIGNFLLLIGIDEDEIYNWFQIMYVDSYDVFMVPNVYGMLCYGNITEKNHMMTKPYLCSSNYLKKMGKNNIQDDNTNEDYNDIFKKYKWDEIIDALYYTHINKYKDKFKNIYATALSVKRLASLENEQKNNYFNISKDYIKYLYSNKN